MPLHHARRRIALYSHDTQGLGHVRRNSEIAGALVAADPETDILLVTGAAEAGSLELPPNTELVVLPSVSKSSAGHYGSSTLSLPLPELLALRSGLIASAIASFAPDLLIVDKEARGLRGELDATLRLLGDGPARRTRVVLGLRDVLDTEQTVSAEWSRADTLATLRRHYDQVWVYGDPGVGHPIPPALRAAVEHQVRFVGYLAAGRGAIHRPSPLLTPPPPPREPYVMCTVGGGQDGADLARAFVEADLPAGHHGVIVTGPYLRRDVLAAIRRSRRDDLTVHGFIPSTRRLISRAAAVVSMGGYNSVCELLDAAVPALVVPRTRPRQEQALRAALLGERTGIDWAHPDAVDARFVGDWLERAAGSVPEPADVDLAGLSRLPALADALIRDVDPVAGPTHLNPAPVARRSLNAV